MFAVAPRELDTRWEGEMDKMLERRMLLRGAGVAGASLVGVTAVGPATASEPGHGGGHDGRDLLGAWRITHTDDPPGGDTGVAIVAFAPGGVVSLEEIPDGTLGLGAWRCSGDGFRARFFESAPAQGSNPGAAIDIRVSGAVHGSHVAGRYRGTVRSVADDSVLTRFTGTFHGHRLEV
jgi:hypothetical protein